MAAGKEIFQCTLVTITENEGTHHEQDNISVTQSAHLLNVPIPRTIIIIIISILLYRISKCDN